MSRWVEIEFDCLPLRSVGRVDVPLDASPKYRALCEGIKAALDNHGAHNTYYLYNAKCVYHLVNHDDLGMIEFEFSGTLFTDAEDKSTKRTDLNVVLKRETCDWLTEPVVRWFEETVAQSVTAEFDRYIAAGDLKRTQERLELLRSQSDESGGYVGLYL